MLSAEGCARRRRRFWEKAPQAIECALIADPQHLMYFANYVQSPFVFRSADAAAVLVMHRSGVSTLIADNLLGVFVEAAFADVKQTPTWYDGRRSAKQRETLLTAHVVEHLATIGAPAMGYEAGSLPAGVLAAARTQRPAQTWTAIDDVIFALRRSKDPDEIALLEASARAGEAGFAAARKNLKPGMTELQAFLLVQQAACEQAGRQVSIYGDFVSGPRCEQIGGPPSLRTIQKGDLFLLDFSVVIDGYRCDFANTFAVGAPPADRQRQLGDACVAAMAAGEEKIRPGVRCQKVDQAVRNSFATSHLEKTFPHHSGHGVGLGHPEPPFFVPESDESLAPGDVVTIEPGQYHPNVAGMRFERNYLVTENGNRVLTNHQLTMSQG